MSHPQQPLQSGPTPPPAPKVPLLHRRGLQVGATAVVALLAGAAIGVGVSVLAQGSVENSPEYVELTAERDSLQGELAAARADLGNARAEMEEIEGDLPRREEELAAGLVELKAAQAELTRREVVVAGSETAVAEREKAVGIAEVERAANTIPGEGMYRVGTDMKAGTYRTEGASGCYYAVLRSTSTHDIAENNNIDGPGFVTVREGQYFETTRCADWIRQ
ncbi:hypothetical protein [Nocardioides sp. AE5]|uniref:hypothetical protein n=1 Tax=Nocardioides sp. AE5 TaxID=2962573 RepID=UPI002881EAE1|nr:hypothetical protein [Nocardioides sp. AE5]MDT0201354.1 hypothetical protein [Nocardioides sp. AE5]